MLASDPPSKLTRTDFLAGLKSSGLEAMPAVRRALTACAGRPLSPEEMARSMVDSGALTQFQADRLLAGKTDGFVIGRYVVLDQLGIGPVSRVYRARHTAMDRFVALKVLAGSLTKDEKRRATFQAELQAAAGLSHPNIVTVLDVNQIGRRLFVVMEYVEGSGADALIASVGPLSIAHACEAVRLVALGVQAAHEKGIVHGAIYPGCVLVGATEVKLTGFGLGHLLDTESPASRTATNPLDFRAPELPARFTPAADVYSLGRLLAYLLTGRTTLAASDNFRPDASPALVRFLRLMLAKDPAARPSSQDVVAFLERIHDTDDTVCNVGSPGMAPTVGGFLDDPDPIPSDEAFTWSEIGQPTVDDAAGVTSTTLRRYRPASGSIRWLAVAAAIGAAAMLGVALLLRY